MRFRSTRDGWTSIRRVQRRQSMTVIPLSMTSIPPTIGPCEIRTINYESRLKKVLKFFCNFFFTFLKHFSKFSETFWNILKLFLLAHKELRQLQTGHQSESLSITAELKSLLRRTHDGEKAGLAYRTEEALKIQTHAKEAYLRLQRANSSFFGSIR